MPRGRPLRPYEPFAKSMKGLNKCFNYTIEGRVGEEAVHTTTYCNRLRCLVTPLVQKRSAQSRSYFTTDILHNTYMISYEVIDNLSSFFGCR